MKKNLAFFLICFFSNGVLFSQITVDEEKLTNAIKEKLIEEITGKYAESVQKGEQWVTISSNFSIILEPFEPFGIDANDPDFLNQTYAIHKKITEEIEKNPGLKYSSLLSLEIKGLVKNGMWNYASTFIDKDSKEIYSQVSNLTTKGKDQISRLLEAASGITGLNPADDDYQSDVTKILTKYGIKSDYFFIIDDLNQVISYGYDKLADPAKALSIISSAAQSNDPVHKIEMLFELGESFGDKIPVIGNLITPIFTMGKGVLNAAKGLENIFERNLNQGCISPGSGTYGSVNDNKRTRFISKFPEINRACPINQNVYSPVYNNIYLNTSAREEIFFYKDDNWFRGKNDGLHKGETDIFAAVQWLRNNQLADKATDLEFIFNCYQKEYGWSVYKNEVNKRVIEIRNLFLSSYSTVEHCDQENLKDFFMNKIGMSWLSQLLKTGDIHVNWDNIKYFTGGMEEDILNQMIKNYYLSLHQHNLNNLDRIITKLKENTPVYIYGFVKEGNGTKIQGAKIQPGSNSMFKEGDKCHEIVSSLAGNFSYYILTPLDKQTSISVSATLPDYRTISEKQNISLLQDNVRSYNVNLITPYLDDRANNDNIEDQPERDIPEELRNADCANDPMGIAEWDPVNQKVICTCINNYIWDSSQKKCVPNIQAILSNSDCSQWPNTEPKWDYDAEEAYCDCMAGFVWNEDYTNCISLQEQLVAQTDCSQYGNAKAVWDPVRNEVACDCLPGYEWDANYTKCVSIALAQTQNFDCSGYPNTEAVWDPASQQTYCDCLPGYEWNDDFTGCEPLIQQQQQPVQYDCSHLPNSRPVFDPVLNEMVCDCMPGFEWNNNFTACIPVRNKPNIDWGNIINMTNEILNGINAANPGLFPGNQGLTPGTSMQQPVQHQSRCNDQQQAGANTPEVHTIDLGQSFGSFVFDYETFNAKDQIIITNGGATIFNSGCVGEHKSIRLNLSGFSPTISVRVNPNCDGGTSTQWNFTVHCPGN